MLHVEPGHDVGYLTNEVGAARTDYYTGSVGDGARRGEPPGRWYGAGAETLGLSGEVNHEDLRAIYHDFLDPRDPSFRDPNRGTGGPILGHAPRRYRTPDERYAAALAREPHAGPERRAELRLDADKAALRNVSFFDVTYSPPKSITVLHTAVEAQEIAAQAAGDARGAAAWATYRTAIEDAVWAGWQAGIDYLQDHAGYGRVGHHGGEGGQWADSHRFTVAGFLQHDSRDHDPQLHIHGAVLNRIPLADGRWVTLDGKALNRWKLGAGSVADRTTSERVMAAIPWVQFRMRPDGVSREIVGIRPEVMDLFSSRRRAITPKVAELVAAFRAKFGRDPNALERVRLSRRASLATRPAKAHTTETRDEQLARWDAQLRAEVAHGLAQVAHDVISAAEPRPAEQFDERAVIETALAQVQAERAAWTRSELTKAVNSSLPDRLDVADGTDVAALLDGITGRALNHAHKLDAVMPGERTLPDELRLDSGESVFARPGDARYATDAHLRSEAVLRQAAASESTVKLTREQAAAFVTHLREQGIELGADQAAAARGVFTSGSGVESLVGPAGTGKSFTVGMIAHGWQDRALWGEQHRVFGLATAQRATETLADDGVEHARNVRRWLNTQTRLAEGRPLADDNAWQLSHGDLVVVDESAMTATADLTAVHDITSQHGAKLLLVGDHRQLAAVGAGGGMDLVTKAGRSYELTEARRFRLAWEREASLRLREHDLAALVEYRKHGRIHDSGTIEQAERDAVRAWLADTLRDKQSLLIADTNEGANRMSAAARAELVARGRVEETGVPIRDGLIAGVGDVVQARHNDWTLGGWEGNRQPPINRGLYRVTETREDGGLSVAPLGGGDTMRLPGRYVGRHVSLGYASTVHSAQSLTVDTSHVVATDRTGADAFYVGMSRGTQSNTAHVVTLGIPADAPPGMVKDTPRKDPLNVVRAAAERHEDDVSATILGERLAERAANLKTAQERFSAAADRYTQMRTGRWLDELAAERVISPADRRAIAADPTTYGLANVLRRAEVAGHDPRQVLRDAATERGLHDARSIPTVLHSRIADRVDLTPRGDRFADWVPGGADRVWARHFTDLAADADARVGALQIHRDDDSGRENQPATTAASRELEGWADTDRTLPPPPKPGQVEQYAMWRAAWRDEGRPEDIRAEAEMSDGQLRKRVDAARREDHWAPDYVGPELAATHEAAARHRADAALHTAEGRRDDAHRSDSLATLHAERAVELERADEARTAWWVHTAATREAADRARLELSTRGVDADTMDRPVTGEQWLAEQRRTDQAEETHRTTVHEDEMVRPSTRRTEDRGQAETKLRDVRETAAREPRRTVAENDWTRVPSDTETAESVSRAGRALREIHNRRDVDAAANVSDRDRQLAQWAAEDADRSAGEGDVAERIPSLA